MNNRMRHFIVKLMCDELGCKDISEIAGFAFYKKDEEEEDVPIMPEPVSGADGYVYDGMVLPKHIRDDEFRYAIMYGSGSVRLYLSTKPCVGDPSSTFYNYGRISPPYRVYTYDRATNSWGTYTETTEGSDYRVSYSYVMWSNYNLTRANKTVAVEGTTPRAFYLNRANSPTAFLYSSGKLGFQSNSKPESGYEVVGAYVDWENCQRTSNISVPWLRIDKSSIESVEIAADAIPAHTDYWFYGCSVLERATLPEGLKKIGDYMFRGSKLYSFNFPSTIEEIGDYAYAYLTAIGGYNTYRETITIPDSVKRIGDYAFYDAKTSYAPRCAVVIGAGCEEIGRYAFGNNIEISTVTIGASVKRINPYAFYRIGIHRAGISHSQVVNASVTFKNTSGWWVSKDADATSGTSVSVTNASTNGKNISCVSEPKSIFPSDGHVITDGAYYNYYWNRT